MGQTWRLIYQLAGYLGLDPGPYSLRQLFWMAEGRRSQEWSRTSTLCALIANVNRDSRRRSVPFSFYDFLPGDLQKSFGKPRDRTFTKSDLHALKSMFGGG